MSDSDNYFSDSDKSIDIKEEKDDPFEDPPEEMDEETLQIIYEASRNKTFDKKFYEDNSVIVPKKVKKEKKSKPSNNMSLKEFTDKLEESKPKKWKGSKFDEKKKKLGLDSKNIYKRCFNPRLPPPNHLTFKKERKKDFSASEEDFPELDKDDNDTESEVYIDV